MFAIAAHDVKLLGALTWLIESLESYWGAGKYAVIGGSGKNRGAVWSRWWSPTTSPSCHADGEVEWRRL